MPPMRSKAFLACATFWPSLCPIVSNRVFATVHFPVAYWAAPAKLERPGMTLDLSIHLKSMSIIVAPYVTVLQAAFPVMGLAASPHRFEKDLVAPSSWNPEVDTGLGKIVLRCMEKNPAKRYATARELLDALDNSLHRGPIGLAVCRVKSLAPSSLELAVMVYQPNGGQTAGIQFELLRTYPL